MGGPVKSMSTACSFQSFCKTYLSWLDVFACR